MKRCKDRKARHLKRKIQNMNAMTAMSANKTKRMQSNQLHLSGRCRLLLQSYI